VGACTALALAASAAPTAAQPTPHTYFVRAYAGGASQELGDWKQYIASQRDAVQGGGPPIAWRNIGGALVPGVELGYMLNQTVSFGATLTYQRGTADNHTANANASLADKIEASAIGVTVNATSWPAVAPGVFVGLNAGLGLGRAKETIHFHDFYTSGNDRDQFGNWGGVGFMGGVFAGYQESFSPTGSVFVRTWYQRADLGVFDQDTFDPQQSTYPSHPGDGSKSLGTDLSGFGVAIGMAYEFGGAH
jgi:hypothetical protein